tara:strand:- start:176 stop:496 length:321 start_codon:yes stop_codon:yes gene_type:complete
MTKKKIAAFTTVTDYRQEFEICLNDIWDDYIADQEKAMKQYHLKEYKTLENYQPFDDEDKDINTVDEDELCNIAWEYILKDPKKYRTCDPDYDNENILEQSITEED